VVASVAVKEERISDEDSLASYISKAKGKQRARMTTPIEISSDDDAEDTPQAAPFAIFN
jgi:hypothetical protein